MKILFMGTPDFAVPSLRMLVDEGHEIVGVVTQPDKPQGRKMVLTPPAVKVLALELGLPVFQPELLKNEAFLPQLQQLQPDLIVVVAYGKILPPYILEYPTYGCINVHGSLLPKWRGAAPIQWSILAGDATTGVTTMQMDKGLDTGAMLLKYETEIGAQETAGELFDRLSEAGGKLLIETLIAVEQGTVTAIAQQDDQSSYASMLSKDMAQMDWSKSASELDCLVRGMNPWPIAHTLMEGKVLKVYAATIEQASGAAGMVLDVNKNGILVACGQGALRITQLQAIGGKRMSAGDYLRGHTIEVGSVLG